MSAVHRLALEWVPRRDEADGGAPAPDWRQRHDLAALDLAAPQTRASDGALLVKGYAAREGILVYRNADGTTRRELVTAETLRRAAPTLTRAPVTLEHPREDVTPDNVARYGVGDVDGRSVVYDDGYNEVSIAVRRRDAITAIRGGKVGLSPGYRVRLDETPGVHPIHGPYDAVQVEREYNHLAIVGNPRGGATVRLRADGLEPETFIGRTDGPNTPAPTGRHPMKALLALLARLGGDPRRVDSTNEDQLADAIGEAVAARIDEADARTEAMKAERDQAKARADGAEARLKLAKEQEAARKDAADRESLAELAASHKVDAKAHATAPALRRAIAIAARPKLFEGAERSDAYVETLIDLIRADALETAPRNDAGEQWRRPAGNPPPVQRTDASGFSPMREALRRSQTRRAGGE